MALFLSEEEIVLLEPLENKINYKNSFSHWQNWPKSYICAWLLFIVIIFFFSGSFYSSPFGGIVKNMEVLAKFYAIWRWLTSPYILLCSCGLVKWANIVTCFTPCALFSLQMLTFLSSSQQQSTLKHFFVPHATPHI